MSRSQFSPRKRFQGNAEASPRTGGTRINGEQVGRALGEVRVVRSGRAMPRIMAAVRRELYLGPPPGGEKAAAADAALVARWMKAGVEAGRVESRIRGLRLLRDRGELAPWIRPGEPVRVAALRNSTWGGRSLLDWAETEGGR